MATKGTEAKEKLINKFINANKENYIGIFDKKHYFWSEENGEKVQVCITMTCPKTPVGEGVEVRSSLSDQFDWGDGAETPVSTPAEPVATISAEEQANLEALMAKLGL